MLELPVKKKAKERRLEQKTIIVLRDGDRVAIRKRPSKGLLAGLYEFPCIEGEPTPNAVYSELAHLGVVPLSITETPPAKHVFTHIEWHMTGIEVMVDASKTTAPEQGGEYVWATLSEMKELYAIPSAYRAFVPEAAK